MSPSLPFSRPVPSRIQAVLLLVCAGILVYFNSLAGSFQFDDRNLLEKPWIEDLDAFKEHVSLLDFQNRPVLLLTYALNNTLQANQAFGFHAINLLLHLWVTLLIYCIVLKTRNWVPERRHEPGDSDASPLPFLSALLFAVHPLNTDSVSYISSRSTLLTAFFYLLALYAFVSLFSVRSREIKPRRILILALTVPLFAYLSLASKLIAVTLPAALALWFFAFICPREYPDLWQRLTRKRSLTFFALAIVFSASVLVWIGPDVLYTPKDQGVELFGRWPYFWVQMKVIAFHYLKLFVAPFNLNVDIGFPFTRPASDPAIAFAVAILAALVYSALRFGSLWVRVGTLWFLIALAPTSSLVPLNDLAVEHRLYLPMTLGLCLIAACALRHILRSRPLAWALGCVLLLSAGTLDRNRVWIDEFSLWQDAAMKNPHSPRTHNNLGKAHYEAGDLEQALRHFQKSVASIPNFTALHYNLADPSRWLARSEDGQINVEEKILKADFAEPHYNLASVHLDLGQLANAAAEYQRALHLQPGHYGAHLGLGSVHARLGQLEKAESHYRKALAIKTASGAEDDALARLNLGELYGKSGRFEEAIRQFHRAVQNDPSLMLAHYNLGVAHSAMRQWQQAERWLSSALSLDAAFQPALFNLGRVLQEKKQWDRSSAQFERYLKLKGPDARAHYQIGWNHQQQGRLQQAETHYEKSLSLQANFLSAHVNLGKISHATGQLDRARRHFNRALALNPTPAQKEEIMKLLQNLS